MNRLNKLKDAMGKALSLGNTVRATWTESLTFDLKISEQALASELIVTRKGQRGISAIAFVCEAILMLNELEHGNTTRLMRRFGGLVGYVGKPQLTSENIQIPKIDTSVFGDVGIEDNLGDEPNFDDLFDM